MLKYLKTPYWIPVLLSLPNLVFVLLDNSLWGADCPTYGLRSWYGYRLLVERPWEWLITYPVHDEIHMAPLLTLLGEFFVPLGNLIGDQGKGLLLLSALVLLCINLLLFKLILKLNTDKWVAAAGLLFVGSSPLLIGLSNQLWTEPLQLFSIIWVVYAILMYDTWKIGHQLAILFIAVGFSLMVKTSSPLYYLMPLTAWLIIIIRNRDLFRNLKGYRLPVIYTLLILLISYMLFRVYVMNFGTMLDFVRVASYNPHFEESGDYLQRLVFWLDISTFNLLSPVHAGVFLLTLATGLVLAVKAGNKRHLWLSAVFIIQILLILVVFATTSNVINKYILGMLICPVLLLVLSLKVIANRYLNYVVLGVMGIVFFSKQAQSFGMIPVKYESYFHHIHAINVEPDPRIKGIKEVSELISDTEGLVILATKPLIDEYQMMFYVRKMIDHELLSSENHLGIQTDIIEEEEMILELSGLDPYGYLFPNLDKHRELIEFGAPVRSVTLKIHERISADPAFELKNELDSEFWYYQKKQAF